MTDQRKMLFEIFDHDDKFGIESIWVTPRSESLYEVHNVPFYARGVAFLDVVSGTMRGDELVFVRVEEPSGNSTVRVAMFDMSSRKSVCDGLNALGCDVEISHRPNLMAVDVPKSADWNEVRKHLDSLAMQGLLDYEEAVISAYHLQREPR